MPRNVAHSARTPARHSCTPSTLYSMSRMDRTIGTPSESDIDAANPFDRIGTSDQLKNPTLGKGHGSAVKLFPVEVHTCCQHWKRRFEETLAAAAMAVHHAHIQSKQQLTTAYYSNRTGCPDVHSSRSKDKAKASLLMQLSISATIMTILAMGRLAKRMPTHTHTLTHTHTHDDGFPIS